VLGIDPGLNVTGYGVLEVAVGGPKVCEAGVIRGRSRGSLAARLADIHGDLAELIAMLRPSVMAVEQLYSHYKRPRTAILMGHARGVICLAAAQAGLPVVSYASTRVKKTLTNHGRATKVQMQKAVQRELRLPKLPEPHDVGDALAVALCHYYAQSDWAALARAPKVKPQALFLPPQPPAPSPESPT
jgi:crossover junction endodeoxyribonuclease RuvC